MKANLHTKFVNEYSNAQIKFVGCVCVFIFIIIQLREYFKNVRET